MSGRAGDPFVLGVNYWPRRKAMRWWAEFDDQEVREEFGIIAELGMSMVRIFLFWEHWQPTPDTVDQDAVANLGRVADIARDLGLRLNVTFFTGHMSGPNWAPSWMLLPHDPMPPYVNQVISRGEVVDCGVRNPYEDPLVLDAERLLLRTVVERYQDHPGIGIWNLGNEPDNFSRPSTHEIGPTMDRGDDGAHQVDRSGHPGDLRSARREPPAGQRVVGRRRFRGDRHRRHARVPDVLGLVDRPARPLVRPVHVRADLGPRRQADDGRGVRRLYDSAG